MIIMYLIFYSGIASQNLRSHLAFHWAAHFFEVPKPYPERVKWHLSQPSFLAVDPSRRPVLHKIFGFRSWETTITPKSLSSLQLSFWWMNSVQLCQCWAKGWREQFFWKIYGSLMDKKHLKAVWPDGLWNKAAAVLLIVKIWPIAEVSEPGWGTVVGMGRQTNRFRPLSDGFYCDRLLPSRVFPITRCIHSSSPEWICLMVPSFLHRVPSRL